MSFLRKAAFIKFLLLVLSSALLVALIALLLVHRSFSPAALKRELEDAISGQADIEAFHSRYFPPGCVAEALASGTAPAMLRLRTEKPGERIMGSGGPSQTYVAR